MSVCVCVFVGVFVCVCVCLCVSVCACQTGWRRVLKRRKANRLTPIVNLYFEA